MRMPKQTSRRHVTALLVLLLALACNATTSFAQPSPPMRVRGTITQVKGDDVTVKSVEGKVLTIRLAPDARVNWIVPAKLSDIKPGRFVGTAARPKGDK